MTGIPYDAITNEYAILVDTAHGEEHEGYGATASEAAARLEEAVAKWARYEALHNWQIARACACGEREYSRHESPQTESAVEATEAHEDTAPVTLEAAPEIAPRCPFYREIRRAYAIARDCGLDVKADEAMRAEFGRLLGRPIETREAMNGADWGRVGNAMKEGQLSW